MSDDKSQAENDTADANGKASDEAGDDAAEAARKEQPKRQSGPTFTEAPDPLGGIGGWLKDILASMEGRSVSMKTYVGTIIGVVVLMMLARCGG